MRPHAKAEMVGEPFTGTPVHWVSHPGHRPGSCYGLRGTPCPPADNPCTHKHRTQDGALKCSAKRVGEPPYPMTSTYCHSCGCSHYYTSAQLDAHRDNLRAAQAALIDARREVPSKPCRTPGAIYRFSMGHGAGTSLKIEVDLPPTSRSLAALDEAGAMALEDALHDAIEQVLAPYFTGPIDPLCDCGESDVYDGYAQCEAHPEGAS